jgi:3-methyladenine DNA glycosylase AlkD
MTAKEVMHELESLGNEQTRKTYSRHGISDEMFGVSYANLEKLRKKIKTDHALAIELWSTGNHDARILATMIADVAQFTDKQLDAWSKELKNYVLTDAFAKLAAKSTLAQKKAEQWIKSKDEWAGSAGWSLIGSLAMQDENLSDDYFENHLATIENNIHTSKNRIKHAMNGALIGIGLRNDKLEKKALATAKKIGKVEVDHGETNCKTPDAAEYIFKTKQRKSKSRAV